MFFNKNSKFDALQATATKLAEILDAHRVFGDTDLPQDKADEMQEFVGLVVSHLKGDLFHSLELTYHVSNVRLVVDFVMRDNVFCIEQIDAFAHPRNNANMDYHAL